MNYTTQAGKTDMTSETFTARTAAKLLDVNLNKFKRHARVFLPVDPKAGQSTGKTRIYTSEDVFLVFLGEILVERLVPLKIAAEILPCLRSFFFSKGIFPISKWISLLLHSPQ